MPACRAGPKAKPPARQTGVPSATLFSPAAAFTSLSPREEADSLLRDRLHGHLIIDVTAAIVDCGHLELIDAEEPLRLGAPPGVQPIANR